MLLEQLIDGSSAGRFTGRENILKDIYKKIDDKTAAIVVKGPGGSGKTALAGRVAAHLRKKQFAFILIEGRTHPEIILKKIYDKAGKKGIKDAEKIYTDQKEELRKKILWFVEHYLEKEKIMLIFEDFEANLNNDGRFKSERLKEFLIYLRDSLKDKKAFIFFTTEKDIPGFEAEPIGEFSDEEFKKLLSYTNTLKRLKGKSLEKLSFDMGGNPRALQLLDHIAGREFAEKKFEWDTLKDRIPRLRDRVLHKESEEADFSPLLLEKILEYLNESQQLLLKGLSLYGGTVRLEALTALELKVSGSDRKQLMDLSLMDFYESMNLYREHRLTGRFFYGKMSEIEKKELHLKAARYYKDLGDGQDEKDIESWIKAREHYLEAEEWDRAADLTFDLDQYLTPKGYIQLSYDLLKEIEDLDCSWEKQLLLYQRLLVFSTIFSMPDEVISVAEKLLKGYEGVGDNRGAAQSLGQIAMALEAKRKYDDAFEKYERSRKIYEKIGDAPAAAFTLIEMGKIQQKRGKYDEAQTHFEEALALAEKGKDSGTAAESLHNIGQVCEAKGELDKALEHYRKALDFKEKAGDEKGTATELHQIGNIIFLKGDMDTALDYYGQALELSEKHHDLRGQGYSLGQIGLIHQRKGRQEDALELYLKSLKVFEELGDQRGISAGLHQIGRIYQEQGKLDEALKNYIKSLEICEKNVDMNGMSVGHGQLGMLYYEKEEYKEALVHSVKSFLLFARMGAPGAKLAQKNIHKIEKKLPKEEFDAVLKEYNITPADEQNKEAL
jgi:tetratricopeptide (TPR) repeat protein